LADHRFDGAAAGSSKVVDCAPDVGFDHVAAMGGHGMRRVLTAIDWLSRFAAILASVMMVAIMVMMLGEIVARLFRSTLSFAWEYGAYLNGAIFFLAAAYTARTAGHIRVSWTTLLPPPLIRVLELAATSVACSVSALLAVSLTIYAYESYAGWIRSDTITATPLVFPKGALAFGAILLTLQLTARLIRVILGDVAEVPEASETARFER
jgi:TRAP-type C4-dicarboxylate transport system permease small subunit